MENEQDILESENQEGESDALNTDENGDDSNNSPDERYKNQKIRAEKAEKKAKELEAELARKSEKPREETPKTTEYSLKDIRALSDVPDDLVDKVVGWARFNNIEISEAKKSPEMQSVIKTYEEEKKSAEAAATGPGRRLTSKQSDESLLQKLDEGTLPESDIERAVKARIEQRKNQKGN